jgi:chromosome segregation protein
LRLTQIKLAGFKSFVDPTHIPVPGQLVGVVGPNGCGKSNVIDAVRWVLGESQAKQLRGETMQDVIFNGSGGRKPVGRASVELIFDNSLGKAAGQWSQYAEIAVKRVLARNGESAYYLNNVHVRRRDVTDIFLGTGLGARAYAIIEQGMISRIIEARPEELRVFLEEAAGISRYKERRRETALRLNDTRENLLRLDDIRTELNTQLQRLEVQARVAQQYQELQSSLQTSQNLLWLVKKHEAGTQRERFQREVQRMGNELEAETARLRSAESQLEQMRAAHYAAGDALHAVQGELYAANADVARVEQQLQHLRENRQRLENQLAALRNQQAQLDRQRQTAAESLAHWQNELETARLRVEEIGEKATTEKADLPLAEEALRACQQRAAELQKSLAQAEQDWQIEETHRSHAVKAMQQLQARRERLAAEQKALPQPDDAALADSREELAVCEIEFEEASAALAALQEHLPGLEAAKAEVEREVHAGTQQTTRSEARLGALRQVQARVGSGEAVNAWLAKYRLDALPRLWQGMEAEQGWEGALEAVLRERLNAISAHGMEPSSWLGDAPSGKVTLFDGQSEHAPAEAPPEGLIPLRQLVASRDANADAVLDDWLRHVYAAADGREALALRARLPLGALLVCPQGHIFTRHSISFHAPDSETQGVLARQREIEQLSTDLATQEVALEQARSRSAEAQQETRECQAQIGTLRQRVGSAQQRRHALQMEVLKLTQAAERIAQRSEQIAGELQEIAEQLESEILQKEESEFNLAQYRGQVDTLEEHLEDARAARAEAEQALNRQRHAVQAAERSAQEAGFYQRTCSGKIEEFSSGIKALQDSLEELGLRLEEAHFESEGLHDETLKQALQTAVAGRQAKEQALAHARDELEGAANALKQVEEQRLKSEQGLQPLRERLEQARLKEQEARLGEAQFGEQLQASAANEAELLPLLEKNAKPAALQAEIARLGEEVAALGAVNLAALEELTSARERSQYLNAQADDLNQAIDTLESAIRRIDRDTRELLQDTFDTVNRSMGELFPTLFGGGQAYLVLTGEEILDAGVQVVAQPPGKKNSSIHLLSGGEKALTALSLVFSLFKLNPAPFCLLDEVDAPLDDSNTVRFCELVKKMAVETQFLYISHNKIAMEMAHHLIGITMQESGVSRVVAVDIEEAMRLTDAAAV